MLLLRNSDPFRDTVHGENPAGECTETAGAGWYRSRTDCLYRASQWNPVEEEKRTILKSTAGSKKGNLSIGHIGKDSGVPYTETTCILQNANGAVQLEATWKAVHRWTADGVSDSILPGAVGISPPQKAVRAAEPQEVLGEGLHAFR